MNISTHIYILIVIILTFMLINTNYELTACKSRINILQQEKIDLTIKLDEQNKYINNFKINIDTVDTNIKKDVSNIKNKYNSIKNSINSNNTDLELIKDIDRILYDFSKNN